MRLDKDSIHALQIMLMSLLLLILIPRLLKVQFISFVTIIIEKFMQRTYMLLKSRKPFMQKGIL